MTAAPLLTHTRDGLFCAAGGFHIDPWRPVERAIITHAHSDHARHGSRSYLCSSPGVEIVRERVGRDAAIEGIPYGEERTLEDVRVSLHPAGHILGSAQVRIERAGEVWVVSGDYKVEHDPTCAALTPLRCHVFVTESTFALPVYRWDPPHVIARDIDAWWAQNRAEQRTSVLYAYAVGKSQRILASIEASAGPILVHGAVARFLPLYEAAGVALPEVLPATDENAKLHRGRALVIAPPSAAGSRWLAKFAPHAQAMASGWMRVRGTRRGRGFEKGFALSDHADWPGLWSTIEATGAERVFVTHGQREALARALSERGVDAHVWKTEWSGDEGAADPLVDDVERDERDAGA